MNVYALLMLALVLFGDAVSRIQHVTLPEKKIVQTVDKPSEVTTVAEKEEQKRIREILGKIAKKYGSIKRFQAKIHTYEYDSMFRVEKRGTGTLYFDNAGNTRMDVYPLKKDFVSNRKSSDGKNFLSGSGTPRTWIWRKDAVIMFEHTEKVAQLLPFKKSGKEMSLLSQILSPRFNWFPSCHIKAP